jgi:hypothetical protein
LRGSGWRIEVLSQPGKIVHETPWQLIAGCGVTLVTQLHH